MAFGSSSIGLANAPISYGVFGTITVDDATTPAAVLTQMAAAGYGGSELGPPGFFGTMDDTVAAFRDAGLACVGAYIPLHTQGPDDVLDRDLTRMRQTFDELLALGGGLAIFADEGSDTLLAHPRHTREFALDVDGWARLVRVVEAARAEAEDRGLVTSFHPHISTYVEQPSEIDRLLTDTQVGLCFDVAHVALAGGEPIRAFHDWLERVNHVHIKDVRTAVFEQAVASGRTDFDEWWEQLSVPLGTGDLPVAEFAATVAESGYAGWVVVEQDRAPVTPETLPVAIADQIHNLQWLSAKLA